MSSAQGRRFTVYLHDVGTHVTTRHTVVAADPQSALTMFADRGLHTIKVEPYGRRYLMAGGVALGLLAVLGIAAWLAWPYLSDIVAT